MTSKPKWLSTPTAALEELLKGEKNIQLLESPPVDSDLIKINYTFLDIPLKELLEQQNNPTWFRARFKNHLRTFRSQCFNYSIGSLVYARAEEPEGRVDDTYIFGITFLCYRSR
jgi:hypothetical protein